MHDNDDTVGAPIPSTELSRIIGKKFVSASQLRDRIGLIPDHAQAVIRVLVDHGLFVPWLAAQCPNCLFVWPYCKVEDEEHIEESVFCPICNMSTPVQHVDFYEVYQIIRWVE